MHLDVLQDNIMKETTAINKAAAVASGLQHALDELGRTTVEDHDFVVTAYGVTVREVSLLKPDTLILAGFNEDGHDVIVLAHYTQLVAHVVCRPVKADKPLVTHISGIPVSQK
jgi:hypothetical protein